MANENGMFTPNEVMVRVEDFKGEFRVVAEGVVELHKDMGDVKERLSSLEVRTSTLEDAILLGFPMIHSRLPA